jgi:hypothetical protein
MSILTVQYPPDVCGDDGSFSSERLTDYHSACKLAVENAARKSDLKIVKHHVLLLVDLQGVYLGVIRWLAERNFPTHGGMVASRIAHFMLEGVVGQVEKKVMEEFSNGVIFNDLVRRVFRKEHDQISLKDGIAQIVDIKATTELFYAPVPLARIEWQLKKFAMQGSVEAGRQLGDIQSGLLKPHGDARDYAHYDDFIACLKKNATVSRWEEGFFNFYVSASGLKAFDEKEVDTRIVIRAVDACNDYEADSICLISSDQDFVPLHERADRSGVRSYQADASKFATPDRIGRRIKELGDKFIPVAFNPQWPMRVVFEACGHDPFNGVPVGDHIRAGVSSHEFSALCQLHNEMNDDFHLEAVAVDGETKVRVIAPATA